MLPSAESRMLQWTLLALGFAACATGAAVVSSRATPAGDPGTEALHVPEALARRTSLELSGLVWAPRIQRYLAVSDDVTDGTRKHAPWIFTIDDQGRIDADPLTVGTADLNDPEAICAGPDGTFFVSTSHSVSKHGKLEPARRRLLHLRLTGNGQSPVGAALTVLGEVDLTNARSEGGAPALPAGADVEALAFSGGALLVGLKAPLAEDGSAQILRITDPVSQLRAGAISAGSLTHAANVHLCFPGTTPRVCQGIADLLPLPEGGFLVLGNAPKGAPTDGGGAFWHWPSETAAPVLVRRFVGLKPEGIAFAPGPGQLRIVFDTDGATPTWLRTSLAAATSK